MSSHNRSDTEDELPFGRHEIVSKMVHLAYDEFRSSKEIAHKLKKFGGSFTEDNVNAILSRERKRMRFFRVPPPDVLLAHELKRIAPEQLAEAVVVPSDEVAVAADAAASLLCGIMADHVAEKLSTQRPFVIGLVGGRTPNLFARALARRLADYDDRAPASLGAFPKSIVIRPLLGAISLRNPDCDPNAYVAHFAAVRSHFRHIHIQFETFPAPGLLLRGDNDAPSQYPLHGFPVISECFEPPTPCDVIVGSCGHWSQKGEVGGHASLCGYVREACSDHEELEPYWHDYMLHSWRDGGAIGDVCGSVIDAQGNELVLPSRLELPRIMSLDDLSEFVQQGGRVLLVVGRCGGKGCQRSKGELLSALFKRQRLPVTHLVADARSVDDCCLMNAAQPVQPVRWLVEGRKPVTGRIVQAIDSRGKGELEASLRARYGLEEVSTVRTLRPMDVAHEAALRLLAFMKRHKEVNIDRASDKITIGIAGGHTPSLMIQALASLLSDPMILWNAQRGMPEEYPSEIEFRSLVGVVNNRIPQIDPNTYVYQLAATQSVQDYFTIRYATLPAPGVVTESQHEILMRSPLVAAAQKSVLECDIVIVACGHWGQGHNALYDYLDQSCAGTASLRRTWARTVEEAARRGVVGDVGWCPLDGAGDQIRFESGLRIIQLLDWSALYRIRLEARSMAVMLLAAPCSGASCSASKANVLESALTAVQPSRDTPHLSVVSHLVSDAHSAEELMRRS